MADTLLHITCARKLLSDGRIHKEAANLLATHVEDFALGAAIHDLPYFDNVLKSGLRKLRGIPEDYAVLGQKIHLRHGALLCTRAVQRADSSARFALAAGMVTHFALDVVFHPYIERRVAEEGLVHGPLENEIGLHCHYDLVGHSGVGNDYCRDTMSLRPSSGWGEFYTGLLQSVHGVPAEPDLVAYFDRCLRGVRLFGALHGVSFVPWVKVLADDDPSLANASLEMLDQSLDDAVRYVNQAFDAYRGGITAEEWEAVLPRRRLSDGAIED